MLELDVLFRGYKIGTSPQKLYEDCDFGVNPGDALKINIFIGLTHGVNEPSLIYILSRMKLFNTF